MYWSRTSTFQTGGPGGLDGLMVGVADLVILERAVEDASVGLLRFSRVSKALVCACCRVGGVAFAY